MSDPFVGEIRIFGFNFPPSGWALCNGQILPISQNTALFSLLGTNYGGDGKSNFALPNLQGSAPLQEGQGPGLSDYFLGQTGGAPTVTLLTNQIPSHNHVAGCANGVAGTLTTPAGNVWAPARVGRQAENRYSASPGTSPLMAAQAVGPAGNSFPHNNMPPYLAVNFCIALQGIFPARS
jgi:microcystin-dependent protein